MHGDGGQFAMERWYVKDSFGCSRRNRKRTDDLNAMDRKLMYRTGTPILLPLTRYSGKRYLEGFYG